MFLHVSNGHAATRLIEQAGLPGRTQVWCDPLNEGPVPGGITDEELLLIRARFLASDEAQTQTIAQDLRHWRHAVDDEQSYDELILWFEHDLFDQLNLIQLLAHLGGNSRSKPASLICIGGHPGHPHFKGLGELTPGEIAALFPLRRTISAQQIEIATRAWAAYRCLDPRALEEFLDSDSSALPLLAPSLARHLEEFPSDRDGLSRTERRMLEQAGDGAAAIADVFSKMHEGESAYYIADAWFLDRARDLANASPPLLQLTIAPHGNGGLPPGTFALTAAGRSVLHGGADRVKLCGIDRWLGGVHLHRDGPDWRWSDRAGRLLRSA